MPGISLEHLKEQIKTLRNDEKKTKEKLFEILGAIKVIEFLIVQSESSVPPVLDEVKSNGAR